MRAAAVSALARFGAAVEDLRLRVIVLLKRALYDNDDEGRRGPPLTDLITECFLLHQLAAASDKPCCLHAANLQHAPPPSPQVRDRATLHLSQLQGHLGGPDALLAAAKRRVSPARQAVSPQCKPAGALPYLACVCQNSHRCGRLGTPHTHSSSHTQHMIHTAGP